MVFVLSSAHLHACTQPLNDPAVSLQFRISGCAGATRSARRQSEPDRMTRRRALNDRIAPTDRHDPIERNDAHEAIEPIDSTEPTEPIDSTEPLEPIDSTES
jgi:hypothetical protein